jgi:hypothetical protein
MSKFRNRLSVEGLEARWTPAASSIGFAAAAGQMMAGMAFFQAVSKDPGWMFNSAFKPFVAEKMQQTYGSAHSAQTTFQDVRSVWQAQIDQNPANAEVEGPVMMTIAGLEGVAQAEATLAQTVGNWIGVSVVPSTPTPPTPTPKPTDAGMTNTMPDPNSPSFVQQGTQGLKVWDVVTGTGAPVAAGDTISVFYSGWLASNGTKFDSRRSPASPATFALSGLIQGWQQGVPGMKPGGIRRLFVPAALGYGATGSPPNIPGNADLVFEIKLISHHA